MKTAIAAVCALVAVCNANALTVTPTNNAAALTAAVQSSTSGLTITGSSVVGSATQTGTYSGFTLAPSTGSTPTLSLPNGIVLTSGTAVVPSTNTLNAFNGTGTSSAGLSSLSTLSGFSTSDASALNLSFTTVAGVNSVSAQFVFGTDEFPTQSVTDIFGFFVDGVNYAKFANGELISNKSGSSNFIANPLGTSPYGIEYNGLTNVLTVTGLLDATKTTHTLQIAIADTTDSIFQSGVYIGNLSGNVTTGGGGITPAIPEPSTYAMMAACLGALVAFTRKNKQA